MVAALLRFILNGVLTLALLMLSAMLAGGVMALTQTAPVASTTPEALFLPQSAPV